MYYTHTHRGWEFITGRS